MPSSAVIADIRFTRALFRAYLLLLFLVPLPLGGNRTMYWTLLVAGLALLALAWSIGYWRGMARWPGSMRRAFWPLLALVLFAAWSALQLMPAPWVPDWLLPALLRDSYALAGAPARMTADPRASADMLLLTIGLLLLAALTVCLVRSERRALAVLATMMLAGLLQALYGTFMVLSGLEYGFLEPKVYNRGLATGTFINRNHFANFMLLSLAAGIGLMLSQMDLRGNSGLRRRAIGLLRALLGPKALLRAALVVMVIALVLTRSRMGNAAFFGALTLVGLVALWRLRQPSRPLLVLVASVLVMDVFIIGSWFGVEEVIDRVQHSVRVDERNEWEVADRNRVDTNRESLAIARHAPVTGLGGGTFYTLYPAWRGDDQQFMDHAHNDYFEFLIGHGMLGLGLLGAFILAALARAGRGLRHRDRPGCLGISFATAVAVAAMLIHGAVDFSLQIPANAAWFVVLCLLPFSIPPQKPDSPIIRVR